MGKTLNLRTKFLLTYQKTQNELGKIFAENNKKTFKKGRENNTKKFRSLKGKKYKYFKSEESKGQQQAP